MSTVDPDRAAANLDEVIRDFARFWEMDEALARDIILTNLTAMAEPLRAEFASFRAGLPRRAKVALWLVERIQRLFSSAHRS